MTRCHCRRPRPGRPSLRSGLLLAGLLAGHAAAAGCADPEVIAEVTVLGAARGSLVIRLSRPETGLSVALPASALRGEERRLIAETLSCDGEALVRLGPDVRVSFDENSQALRVSAPAAALGSGVADLGDARLTPPAAAGEASWALAFGAQGAAQLDDLPAWSGGGYVDVSRAAGAWTATAGVSAQRGLEGQPTGQIQGQLQVTPRFTVTYTPRPDLALFAAWNAQADGSAPGAGMVDFRGIGIAGQGGGRRVWPDYRLDLPLPAEVTVQVGERPLRTFSAAAGQLTLRNVPLPADGATVNLTVSDETGERTIEERVPAAPAGLAPGAYLYRARAGWTASGMQAEAAAQFGLRPHWNLSAQGSVSRARYGVSARATYSHAGWLSTLGASAAGAWGEAGALELTASLARTLGAVQLQGTVQVPLAKPGAATLGLAARSSQRELQLGAQASMGLGGQWQVGATISRSFAGRGSVFVSGEVIPDGYRAALRGTVNLGPRWQVGAGVTEARRADLLVQFTPDEKHRFEASLSPDGPSLNYGYQGPVRASARIGRDVALDVRGAAVLTGQGLSLQPQATVRGLLVRTGVSGVPLLVGGARAGTTDARGDLLVTGLPLGETVRVQVDLGALRFGVSVAAASREVTPPLTGVATLDWRENFREFRWVQYFQAPGLPARQGSVLIGGERVLLDDEGNGLTPVLPQSAPAVLEREDGVKCELTVVPEAQVVTCPAAP